MKTEDIIRAAVGRCDLIRDGIAELTPFLDPVLPLENSDLAGLSPVQRIATVALLKRYEQLQDMLGRLFRAYLDWEAEDVRAMTRRDQANQFEKLGIIDDADEWIDATELRNRLAHEYPIEEDEQVRRVNDSWHRVRRLVAMYARLRARLSERNLVAA